MVSNETRKNQKKRRGEGMSVYRAGETVQAVNRVVLKVIVGGKQGGVRSHGTSRISQTGLLQSNQ